MGTSAVTWALSNGSSTGKRAPGPWGSAHDRTLSSRGVHPDSPSARYALHQTPKSRAFQIDHVLLGKIFNRWRPTSEFVDPLNLYLCLLVLATLQAVTLADAGSIEALIRRVNRGMAGASRRIESAESARRILREAAIRMGMV